jgi:ubiquitin carboxyl-terminal hydrolase L5
MAQFENSLRRHNHLGTIHALLLAMAQAELLDGALDNAKTKMAERIKVAQEKRAQGESGME